MTLKKVTAVPLTEAAFAPYGGILASGLELPKVVGSKIAPSKRYVEPVTPENRYENAPSGKLGRSVVNVSVADPRPGTDGAKGSRQFLVELMERHRFTTQIFVPMSRDAEYLVMVAESKDDKPDMDTLKVFVAGEGQGICYRTGVYHAPMTVVGNGPVTFSVFQHSNGVPDEDTHFFQLPEEDKVQVSF